MSNDPADRRDRQLDKLDELEPATADALRTFAETLQGQKTPQTVTNYVRCLRLMAERGCDPTTADAETVNAFMADLYDDGDGRSVNTVMGYQSAVRAFHRETDTAVDPEEIQVYTRDRTPATDAADIFTEDEIFRLRDAVGRTRDPVRNRAFLELLIYTGQRLHALLTLRVEDVDADDGCFYLNDSVDGLKGATQRGRRRPLFGARKYVREWVEAHPASEGWLFIGDPASWRPGDGHWGGTSARALLDRLGELAEVGKPVNPHAFRHYCVTVLRRDYDLGWDRIHALMGVKRGSDIAETTYAHVDDGSLLRDIEVELGFAEAENGGRLTPPTCPTCGEALKRSWRQCPACREVFAPDAASIDERLGDAAIAAEDPDDRAVYEGLRRLGYGGHD